VLTDAAGTRVPYNPLVHGSPVMAMMAQPGMVQMNPMMIQPGMQQAPMMVQQQPMVPQGVDPKTMY